MWGLTRKSDGEWAGRRHPAKPDMLCASGLRGGVGDDGFAVADDDVLTCERLELGGQITGATMLVDAGFVVCGPELAEAEVGVREQVVDDGQH